jgi:hypothetical protein
VWWRTYSGRRREAGCSKDEGVEQAHRMAVRERQQSTTESLGSEAATKERKRREQAVEARTRALMSQQGRAHVFVGTARKLGSE